MVRLKRKNSIKMSVGEMIASSLNYTIVTLFALACVYPIINVVAGSFSNYYKFLASPWTIWPLGFNVQAYEQVLGNATFWRSYGNSIFITGIGTIAGLFITSLTAYPLSRHELKGKPIVMGLLIFTMIFGAGMIPGYINTKELGLLDTLTVQWLPGCFGAYNTILMINFFKGIAYDYIEAATIDGASEPYIYARIILPLSKPVMASIALFLAVGYWNSYFGAQLYVRNRDLWPMALVLKEMLNESAAKILAIEESGAPEDISELIMPKTIQYASVAIATVPILCIYPFLQKYFAKGVNLGGVKG